MVAIYRKRQSRLNTHRAVKKADEEKLMHECPKCRNKAQSTSVYPNHADYLCTTCNYKFRYGLDLPEKDVRKEKKKGFSCFTVREAERPLSDTKSVPGTPTNESVTLLQGAIEKQTPIRFLYKGVPREVAPTKIVNGKHGVAVYVHDMVQNSVRLFYVSEMQQIEIVEDDPPKDKKQ